MSSSRAFEPRQLKFKLRSCDDQIIEVEKPVALRIGMVGPMLVDTGEQDGMEIPFPTMKGPVLAKILEFCKFLCRKEDERQGEGKAREHESFENDFIKSMDRSEMLIVMEEAYIVDVPELVTLIAKEFARQLTELGTAEAIRKEFGITDDLPRYGRR